MVDVVRLPGTFSGVTAEQLAAMGLGAFASQTVPDSCVKNISTGALYSGALALKNAVAAMRAGDTLLMGGGLHDLQANGIVINGSLYGNNRTIIRSTLPIGQGCIVSATGTSILENFSIYGATRDLNGKWPSYQAPIGYHFGVGAGTTQAVGNVTVNNVRADGWSDSLYFNAGTRGNADTSIWTFNNCDFLTRWDAAVMVGASAAVITLNNCKLRSIGNFGDNRALAGATISTVSGYIRGAGYSNGAKIGVRGLTPQSGTWTLNNCIIDMQMALPNGTETPIVGIEMNAGTVTMNGGAILTNSKSAANSGMQLPITIAGGASSNSVRLNNVVFDPLLCDDLTAAGDGISCNGQVLNVVTPLTVATLPTAATAGAGCRLIVSDANATTAFSIVAGGGANKVCVISDSTNWYIAPPLTRDLYMAA